MYAFKYRKNLFVYVKNKKKPPHKNDQAYD